MTDKTYRILVTGSRHCGPFGADLVRTKLAIITAPLICAGFRIVLVEGRCHLGGVDRVAQHWALQNGIDNEGYPATITPDGKVLGPQRNARMVAKGAQLCVAFPAPARSGSWTSGGTWNCLRQAVDAGIPARIYPLPKEKS